MSYIIVKFSSPILTLLVCTIYFPLFSDLLQVHSCIELDWFICVCGIVYKIIFLKGKRRVENLNIQHKDEKFYTRCNATQAHFRNVDSQKYGERKRVLYLYM